VVVRRDPDTALDIENLYSTAMMTPRMNE
jgi:hypothetical protein